MERMRIGAIACDEGFGVVAMAAAVRLRPMKGGGTRAERVSIPLVPEKRSARC